MTGQGAHDLRQLCEEALAHPTAEREAFLDERCAGNDDLRRAVAALLAEEPVMDGFLASSAWTPERLHLAAGARLGPYEVQSLIGIGGMGEVYKARDTRLGRMVAIKLLPADLARDVARRQRLEQEARAVAALNHPHICTLYDVSEHDGSMFLVMEHLDGETLAHRIHNGPLPIEQALTTATEIAEALSAAHRRGITHRDLKPGNVMLTKRGAKLLDFGLAKLAGHGDEPAAAQILSASTRSMRLTGEGVFVGTLPYMAPEQLEGEPVDARTDLWAFGAILYEMVTGTRAFDGASAASLIGAILEREPAPLTSRQPLTPPALDRLVRRCLAKAPDDRPDTAHDLANELRGLREQSGLGAVTGARAPTVRLRMLPATALVLAGVVASAVLTSWLWNQWRPFVSPGSVVQTQLNVLPAEELNSDGVTSVWAATPGGPRTALTWTRDGRSLVFVGRTGAVQQLYVRALDAAEARPIDGTAGAQVPVVSADGRWVAFWAAGALKKVPLGGGPAMELAPAIRAPRGRLLWDGGGRVYFAQNRVIWQQIRAGGVPSAVTTLGDGESEHIPSCVLPGDRVLLFTVRKRQWTWGDEAVVALDVATGQRTLLLQDAADAQYVPTGHLVFLRRGVLFAVPFDAKRPAATGEQVPLVEGVAQALAGGNTDDITGAGQFAIAASGTLAWVPGAAGAAVLDSTLVSVDRRGRVSPLGSPVRNYQLLRASPDGARLAIMITGVTERGLWLYDLGRGLLTPLQRGGETYWPIWSQDGKQVIFTWLHDGRYVLASQRADGSTPPEVIATSVFFPSSWAPGGRLLGVLDAHDLAVATFGNGAGGVAPLRQTAEGERWPELSPDGHWLAYGSTASGRMEVYVEPYPLQGGRTEVSEEGGESPAWHPNGRELFYVTLPDAAGKRRMVAVPFDPGTGRIGTPQPLFEFDGRELTFRCSPVRCYDVAPDGQRFFVVQTSAPPPPPKVTQINLVLNWAEELKAKVPVGK